MDKYQLSDEATNVIRRAVQNGVLLASADAPDNYTHVWARDSVVTGLAILTNGIDELQDSFRNSLKVLQSAANAHGQIPSNVAINTAYRPARISFGGTAGRTDASFWWIVGAVSYLQHYPDSTFAAEVKMQSAKVFDLADAWEFNGKHLMYVPMSGNWADEYITHGYVLYDQLLRYWALSLAGGLFDEPLWTDKAATVKSAIKQHYLFEQPLTGSLYTHAQQQAISGYRLDRNFIASFSPGDRVERFDGWSIGLLLMLNIPSAESRDLLAIQLQQTLQQYGNKGIPAFWPEIGLDDPAFEQLQNNHSFNFKNRPGHFHNGGIWPVVNGFIAAGLIVAGQKQLAEQISNSITTNLQKSKSQHPFAEYYAMHGGEAGGVKNLCFSASGYLLAKAALSSEQPLLQILPPPVVKHIITHHRFNNCAESILSQLTLPTQNVLAISVAGQSGCGKTTLSTALQKTLEARGLKSILLHQDDYFKLPPRQNHEARMADFNHIGYQEVDAERLENDIDTIKSKQVNELHIPHMNWLTDEREFKTIDVAGANVVIVEGTYTSMLNNIDFRIFINTDYKQTRENRLERSRETIDEFIESVLQKERGLISAHEPLANLIVDSSLACLNQAAL